MNFFIGLYKQDDTALMPSDTSSNRFVSYGGWQSDPIYIRLLVNLIHCNRLLPYLLIKLNIKQKLPWIIDDIGSSELKHLWLLEEITDSFPF